MVSVFMLLLSFFIVLVSNSKFDANRTQSVIDSVSETFAEGKPGIKVPAFGSIPIAATTVDEIFDDLKVGTAKLIPLQQVQVVTRGNTMEMKMPRNFLFLRGEPKLREDRREIYGILSEVLSQWEENATVSVTLIQGTGEGADSAGEGTLVGARAGNFARFFQRRGVPAEHLGVALTESEGDTISLVFTITPATAKSKEGDGQ